MQKASSFDPSDYTLAIKNRGRPPKPWQWEISVAGKSKPVRQSDFFETMSETSERVKRHWRSCGPTKLPESKAPISELCAMLARFLVRLVILGRHCAERARRERDRFFVYVKWRDG